MIEVEDHLGCLTPQQVAVESAEKTLAIVVENLRDLLDGSGLAEVHAAEIFFEKDPFDALGHARGELHAVGIVKDDLRRCQVFSALAKVYAADFAEGGELVTQYG